MDNINPEVSSVEPKSNTKLIVGIIIALIIIVGGYFIFNNSESLIDLNKEIKLGSILILSGEGSSWGEASKNGIEMAVEKINREGGVNGKIFTVDHQDDKGDPKLAISSFQKLTDFENISYIIGPTWSSQGLALTDLAGQKKVVMISPSLGVKEFNESNKYLFNTWPHDFILSTNLAELVYEKGFRSVAVLGAQNVWVKDQTNSFVEKFKQLGGNIEILEEPMLDNKDIKTEILKIKNNKKVDAIVLLTDSYDLTYIAARRIKEFGIKLPIYSITIDKKIIENCQGACDGIQFLTFLTPSSDFEKAYKEKYNREVEIGADSAYDAVMMIAEAMKKTNSTNTDIVSQYLASIKNYQGVSGNLVSDGNRGFIKDYAVKVIENGIPVDVK